MENKDNDNMGYKGVRKLRKKWVSEIRIPKSRAGIWLGSYDRPEMAARAFDAAQFCLRGWNESFTFNFPIPNTLADIVDRQSLSPSAIQDVAARYANEDRPSTSAVPERAAEGDSEMSTNEDRWLEPSTSAVSERDAEGNSEMSRRDWSLFIPLDSNEDASAEFGLYNMCGPMFSPRTDTVDDICIGDENGGEDFPEESLSLWNFYE